MIALGDIGIGEWGLILFLALFLFGPDKLPRIARQLGRFMNRRRWF